MTNLLVISDAPNQPSGLARITRDLMLNFVRDFPTVNVTQLGYNWHGGVIPLGGDKVKPGEVYSFPWKVKHINDTEAWGTKDLVDLVMAAALDGSEDKPDAIFTVYDPARIVGTCKVAKVLGIPVWAYLPIDTFNVHRAISGPALEALEGCQEVIAYGPFGAAVLKNALPDHSIPWLPHGMDASWYSDMQPTRIQELLQSINVPSEFLNADYIIGCVATNQPRKDLGLLFQTLEMFRRDTNQTVKLWLHTDTLYGHWVIPQLAIDFGWESDFLVTTEIYPDEVMKALYSICDATIAPGLGEGFGYPIVESLASGVPVIHGDFGGGADLIAVRSWKPQPETFRLDGSYNLIRPVFNPGTFNDCLLEALNEDPNTRLYCRGSVYHLNWHYLWPRWRSQFKKMLANLA